ncbi:hypothetical protein [Streptomyces sp. EN16]|uniref:hypothetical protein n=1 Tax=Streptomyces sp. EN16 TaxID=212773 RepID=UPI0008520DBB|nr:hypothetical protein [Streptomyces sp. EN16]
MSTVYVVTRGEYSDYGIVQVFGDQESAKAYSDRLNAADPYAYSGVEEYPVRGPDFQMPMWSAQVTTINHVGVISGTANDSHTDEAGDNVGRCETRVTGGRLPLEPTTVRTHGDATRVPQAHSDTVAKLRAELMGL